MYEGDVMNILIYACLMLGICSGDLFKELDKNLSFQNEIVMNSNYVSTKTGNIIKHPPGTWLELLRTKEICLFYKTPFKDKKGILKIASNQLGKCDEIAKSNFEFEKIEELEVSFNKETSNLEFKFKIENKELIKNISLLNFKRVTKFKKYSSNVPSLKYNNVTLNEITTNATLEDKQLCHGVNSNCNSVVENTCDNCPNGFHEVVDYNCPQGGSKYCGHIDCGQKNMPACPRGYEILETKLTSLCFDGSPAGYCAPGLKTFCNEEKILVCL